MSPELQFLWLFSNQLTFTGLKKKKSKQQRSGGRICQEGKTRGPKNLQLTVRTEFLVPTLARLVGVQTAGCKNSGAREMPHFHLQHGL